MAAKKIKVNEKLLELVAETPANKPNPTTADMSYLRSLKKRGYNNFEIIEIARKAGFANVKSEDLEPKPKKEKKTQEKPSESAAEKLARDERLKKYSAEAAAKAAAAAVTK